MSFVYICVVGIWKTTGAQVPPKVRLAVQEVGVQRSVGETWTVEIKFVISFSRSYF